MPRLTHQQLHSLVRTRGLKMTPQRRAIVKFLEKVDHHPTAEEVLKAVNRRYPTTSRATVYNTLNLLKQAALVREILQEGVVRYDPNLCPHHHFICRRCGVVEDLKWEWIPPLPLGELPGKQTADSFEVTLRGLCANCRSSP